MSQGIHSQYSPKKDGATKAVPNKYQGVRLPQEVFVLSEQTPTNGVMSPSAICPESITKLRSRESEPGYLWRKVDDFGYVEEKEVKPHTRTQVIEHVTNRVPSNGCSGEAIFRTSRSNQRLNHISLIFVNIAHRI